MTSTKHIATSATRVMTLLVLLCLPVSKTHVHADRDSDKALAEKFAPILVLTEDPNKPTRRVLNPEPVDILGAGSISNVMVHAVTTHGREVFHGPITSSPQTVRDLLPPTVHIAANKFAFLRQIANSSHVVGIYFDYPGDDKNSWNAAYFPGEGEDNTYAGSRFRNTVYARVFERETSTDGLGSVVIKYISFYPYNDWRNNHEGDWQKINVMVTSRDTSVAEFYGIDYMFHGKSISYYSNRGEISDSPSSISIRNKVSPVGGKYPVAYVSAGGHGHYPTPGNYADAGAVWTDDNLTSHGLVLHPEIANSAG